MVRLAERATAASANAAIFGGAWPSAGRREEIKGVFFLPLYATKIIGMGGN
jgi:hypothetical protein